jgi:hypothetical protein
MANTPTTDDIRHLKERYCDVHIYRRGEEDHIDHLYVFGNPIDIIDMMDAMWLLDNEPDETWENLSAAISIDGHDIVYQPDMTQPSCEVIATCETIEELKAA